MARWRQDKKTGEMIPIDVGAAKRDSMVVRGDIPDFISPIDGTIVSGRRQYRDHCRKHGVVAAQEFTPEFYRRKAKEREGNYTGQHSREETFKRKQEIYNIITRAEQNG